MSRTSLCTAKLVLSLLTVGVQDPGEEDWIGFRNRQAASAAQPDHALITDYGKRTSAGSTTERNKRVNELERLACGLSDAVKMASAGARALQHSHHSGSDSDSTVISSNLSSNSDTGSEVEVTPSLQGLVRMEGRDLRGFGVDWDGSDFSSDGEGSYDDKDNDEDEFDEHRSTLDMPELTHAPLVGAMAVLHTYIATDGGDGLLERAYDLARGVAGDRHSLPVAVSAWRIAMASGYVHSLKEGGQAQAIQFATRHTLPRLISSLGHYWRDENKSHERVEWEDCMSSLLEVVSSMALLLTAEVQVDIMMLLEEWDSGVTKALGHYCALFPESLVEYPMVGKACVQRFLPSLSVGEFQLAMSRLGLNNRELQLEDIAKAWPFTNGDNPTAPPRMTCTSRNHKYHLDKGDSTSINSSSVAMHSGPYHTSIAHPITSSSSSSSSSSYAHITRLKASYLPPPHTPGAGSQTETGAGGEGKSALTLYPSPPGGGGEGIRGKRSSYHQTGRGVGRTTKSSPVARQGGGGFTAQVQVVGASEKKARVVLPGGGKGETTGGSLWWLRKRNSL